MTDGVVKEYNNSRALETDVAKYRGEDRLVVVDFFATWCGPCRMMKPVLANLARECPDAAFLAYDVDCGQTSLGNITAMPTFMIFNKNGLIKQIVGANKAELERVVRENYVAKPKSFTGASHKLGGRAEPVVKKPAVDPRVEEVYTQLKDMGFDENSARTAAIKYPGDLDGAMDFIARMDADAVDVPMEEPAPEAAPVVHNAICDVCHEQIVGIRRKCTVCPNFDLCPACFAAGKHDPSHKMTEFEKDTVVQFTQAEIRAMGEREAERLKVVRAERAQQELLKKEQDERDRIQHGKELQVKKEEWREKKAEIDAREKKREDREMREYERNLRRQIKQDREERRRDRQAEAAPAARPMISAPKVNASTGEVTFAFELPGCGRVTGSFTGKSSLHDVFDFVRSSEKFAPVLPPRFHLVLRGKAVVQENDTLLCNANLPNRSLLIVSSDM